MQEYCFQNTLMVYIIQLWSLTVSNLEFDWNLEIIQLVRRTY